MFETEQTVEALAQRMDFIHRHIGPDEDEQQVMLRLLGTGSLDELIERVVPAGIRTREPLRLPGARSERDVLDELRRIASKNEVRKSFIGMGYHGTRTPNVILRNVLENPAWYTAYTPYQPEISQGRLEALLTFQTMVCDLTAMDVCNASLLDEATAAAEAMTLCLRSSVLKSRAFFVSRHCHPQTVEVIRTRAECLGIEVVAGEDAQALDADPFGILLQYPATTGEIIDYRPFVEAAKRRRAMVCVATDLLALTLLAPPGELGADVALGSSQRFGVPLGYGGPHAAFLACRDTLSRALPGRLVGVSLDAEGRTAYRLALQTREQHIRREKATSNICTAQVLLAVMASMYAVWHGPGGLSELAARVHALAAELAERLGSLGWAVPGGHFFDTLSVETRDRTDDVLARALVAGYNLRRVDAGTIGISLDETASREDVERIAAAFGTGGGATGLRSEGLPAALRRTSAFLQHPVFHRHRSETEMLRYLRALADKDLALDRTMIPLGSCTMKLNATTEMIPLTWPGFSQIHPFAPAAQAAGYAELIESLERMLCELTGYDAVSLQPNSGAQGELAGLLAIRAWHRGRGEPQRNVCLVPSSAHGTNPASAQMAGMTVVVVKCDAKGNVDVVDLRAKAAQHGATLAALMVTYPSTHGVFEDAITEICDIVHQFGGQVYLDGANLNALVGVAAPGRFGADVSHLNLHKTFCIPHGGGGPGVGPVAVRAHLAPYLPARAMLDTGRPVGPVAAAPYGSAGILPISWAYIALMGAEGLTRATQIAILNANYVARCLAPHYPILYSGRHGLVAHECIVDLRGYKESAGVSAEDVAKRLIDFGFHPPTMSFPVAGTLMIEPTESEGKQELDRFCEAMIAIREEIRAIESGGMSKDDNPLRNAPHTASALMAADWKHPYTREQAAYPVPSLRERKYWPPVARVDNAYGDRNLMCRCPPVGQAER